MAWSPEQYKKFEAERSQPFFDLLGMVRPARDMRVVDLGCGTGELTATLHERLHAKSTLGVDNASSMLRKAPRDVRGLSFREDDISRFLDTPDIFDLVFSNAALHWIDDHKSLFAKVAQRVAPGGQLAVQMPANFDYPSHTVAQDVARTAPFAEQLAGWTREAPILSVEDYARLLGTLGFVEQSVRLYVYVHHLQSRRDVIEWVKGTLLTAYEKRLGSLYDEFLAKYEAALFQVLPDEQPFFYPFKRVLLWAQKP